MSQSKLSRDSEVPGLYLRAYSTGKVSYMLVTTHLGRRRWIALGDAERLSIGDARKLASEMREAMSRRGVIELRVRFATLAQRWVESRPWLKSRESYERVLRNHINPRLGSFYVRDITTMALEDLHREWSKRAPYEANRRIEVISSILSYGVRMGLLEKNVSKGVTRNRESPRRVYATRDATSVLLSAIKAEPRRDTRLAFLLILMTGLRKSEALKLRWENVSTDKAGWSVTVSHTKNGREHTVPLPESIVRELRARRRSEGWIFPARVGDGHLSRIENAWSRVRLRANMPELRIHDLRRTFGSLAIQNGVSLERVSDMLNHQSLEVTRKHYAHLSVQHRRDVVEQVGRVMGIKKAPDD